MKHSVLALGLATALGCTKAPPIDSDAWVVKHSCESIWALKKAPRWTWGQYEAILDELAKPRYVVVPLVEFQRAVSDHSDRVVVGMRHDLDGNLCAARIMASMEQQRGIRATYFLNHNDKYYSYLDEGGKRHRRVSSVQRYRELQAMGHEVGLHYDAITTTLLEGVHPREVLHGEIDWLKTHGIDVRGGASHGAAFSYEIPYSNYEIFAGATTRTNAVLAHGANSAVLGLLPLNEFFAYEAYFLGHTRYYSEAGGKWGALMPLSPANGLATLKPGQSAQILIHPVWWGKKGS